MKRTQDDIQTYTVRKGFGGLIVKLYFTDGKEAMFSVDDKPGTDIVQLVADSIKAQLNSVKTLLPRSSN